MEGNDKTALALASQIVNVDLKKFIQTSPRRRREGKPVLEPPQPSIIATRGGHQEEGRTRLRSWNPRELDEIRTSGAGGAAWASLHGRHIVEQHLDDVVGDARRLQPELLDLGVGLRRQALHVGARVAATLPRGGGTNGGGGGELRD